MKSVTPLYVVLHVTDVALNLLHPPWEIFVLLVSILL